jgi:hypothetical protein
MEERVEVIQVIALLCRHGIYLTGYLCTAPNPPSRLLLLARLPDASIWHLNLDLAGDDTHDHGCIDHAACARRPPGHCTLAPAPQTLYRSSLC